MLSTRIRTCGIAVLLGVWGCHEGPAPKPAQMGSATRTEDADAGGREDEDAGADRHVTVGRVGAGGVGGAGSAGRSGAAGGGAVGKAGAAAGGDASTQAGARARAGAGGAADSQAGAGGDASADDDGEGGDEPDDADMAGAEAPSPMAGAGGGSAGRDPLGVLWDLARRTPQGMNAEIIRRYLEALESGDMPAASIEDFLRSIDAEAHCSEGISAQCVAACQVVQRTCGVCLVNDDCREALLSVCGVAAVNCR